MPQDDLRRVPRVSVCCRVDVRDRHGVWTAVTEDICARGCRIVTQNQPRLGSLLTMTFSSDLFPQELEVLGEAVWATSERIGVLFLESEVREGALSPAEWVERVIEHGLMPGPAQTPPHVVPVVVPAPPSTGLAKGGKHPPRDGGDGNLVRLPLRRR